MVNLKCINPHFAACCLTDLLCHSCHSILLQTRNYSSARNILTQNVISPQEYPYINPSGLDHWYKKWQHLRRHKLTASTFSSAVGFWPKRRVQLWLEKIGAIEPFVGNMSTYYSNGKEELALLEYKLLTGHSLSFPDFQVYEKSNHKDEWLGASADGLFDGYIYDGLPFGGVLEIKCPYPYIIKWDETKKRRIKYINPPWKRIPIYYIPQAQGLLEILDREWMDMYVWTPYGNSLFRMYRNEVYWNGLKRALSDFWWNHVHPAREKYENSVISDPLQQLRSFKPAPKHELFPELIIASKRLVESSMLLRREFNGDVQVFHPEHF